MSNPLPQVHGSEKLLECPVCYSPFELFIHMCEKGHNICDTCKDQMEACPLCRGEFKGARNFALEQLASKSLKFACENAQRGCPEVMVLTDIKKHHSVCMHRTYKCLVPDNCEWRGPYDDLRCHIISAHSSSVSPAKEMLFCDRLFSSSKVGHRDYFFIEFNEELFAFFYKRDPEKPILFNVYLIGDHQHASNFKYKLEFENENRSKNMVLRSRVSPDGDLQMTEENSLVLDCKTAAQFKRCTGTLQYFLTIKKAQK